jgi:hypothetical protein
MLIVIEKCKKMKKIMRIVLCTTMFHSYPCQTRSIAFACLSSRAFKGRSKKIKD